MRAKPFLITSVPQLRLMAREKEISCFLLLNGNARSSKTISFDLETDSFVIEHHIDDSTEILTAEQLINVTGGGLMANAIQKGQGFYAEPSEDYDTPQTINTYSSIWVNDESIDSLDLYSFPTEWENEDVKIYLKDVLGYDLESTRFGEFEGALLDHRNY